MDAINFLREVDRMSTLGNLDQTRTASMVISKLTGVAKEWYNVLAMRKDPGINQWSTLKPLLQQRFVRKLNMAEVAKLFSGLTMRGEEEVRDFRYRVETACLTEDIGLAEEVKTEPGYNTGVDRKMKRLFVQGLSERIRANLLSLDIDAADMEQLQEAACRAEAMFRMAPLSASIASADVAAAQYRGGQGGRGRGGGGYRGGGRGGGGGSRRPPRDPKTATCFRCRVVGHFVKDCKVSADKVKTLNPAWDDSKRRSNRSAAVEHEEGGSESWADETDLERPYEYDDDLN